MTSATDGMPEDETVSDATPAVAVARRGFKRDVAALVRALRTARLFVPLARRIEEVPVGVEQLVGDDLQLSPHLLFGEDRVGFLPLFTRPEFVENATNTVGWTTGDGPLEYCALPGQVAMDLGLSVVDDERIGGVVLNPLHESELVLLRHEIGSIAQGRPLPLVGYVSEIPVGEDEERLIAEMDGPPPEEMVEAIEGVLAGASGKPRHSLHRTFNAERDLEPHLTLNVTFEDPGAAPDRARLGRELAEALDGLLPPPHYIDILFDDPKLG
ncbi:MAG TPA: SseB family protein [Polyangiaceae bacterium]|nr:SseB family protein [Polyangiaceae bacterium]